MSNIPPIQNLPPISSINDPAVRNYLQALSNGWRVRNGEVGDGDEKFLTVKDLKDGMSVAASEAASSSGSATPVSRVGSSGIASKIAAEYKKLSNAILQSRLWKDLEMRIALMETPDWFDKQFGAAIKTQDIIRETANQAIADRVEASVAKINDNLAIAQTNLTAVSSQAGATASNLTTLQTTVGGVSSVAQQAFSLSQNIDGKVKSAWTVKVDANGYVAGFGFGLEGQNGTFTSDFYVRADRFAVGSPGVQKVVPFFVQGGKTYINTAIIQDASIGNAKIGNASVDTLQIAGNAVTVPAYAAGIYSAVVTLSVPVTTSFVMVGTFAQGATKKSHRWDLVCNGVLVSSEAPIEGVVGAMSGVFTVGPGYHYFQIYCHQQSGDGRCGLTVLGVKR